MFYMGDEYGHTKGGNNNTYCHDHYVSPMPAHINTLF
jgi:isoamylase